MLRSSMLTLGCPRSRQASPRQVDAMVATTPIVMAASAKLNTANDHALQET